MNCYNYGLDKGAGDVVAGISFHFGGTDDPPAEFCTFVLICGNKSNDGAEDRKRKKHEELFKFAEISCILIILKILEYSFFFFFFFHQETSLLFYGWDVNKDLSR